MRAIVLPRYGGPDVLELQEVDRPVPADHEVSIRVVVSGTDPVGTKLRQNAASPIVVVREAHERLDSGHGTRDIVLRVAPE